MSDGDTILKVIAVISACFTAYRAGHSSGWNDAIDMVLERFPHMTNDENERTCDE